MTEVSINKQAKLSEHLAFRRGRLRLSIRNESDGSLAYRLEFYSPER